MLVKGKSREARILPASHTGDWITVGWQGVTLDVPAYWSITAVSGDEGSGSARIERTGENHAGFAPFGIDIRWSDAVKSAQTAEQLDRRIEPLIDTAIKSAKKSGADCRSKVVTARGHAHAERGEVREYSWHGSPSALGRIWRCAACGRLMIAQVQGTGTGAFTGEARAILNSMSCHSLETGWRRWALYGIDVDVPDDYGLVKHQLMTTYLELKFGKIKGSMPRTGGDTITIEQWSAANVQLKGAYLDEWIEAKSPSLMASVDVEKDQSVVNGHPALQMIGSRKGFGYWIDDGLKALKSLMRPAGNYSALAWECPDSNKVYLVQQMAAEPGSDLALRIASRLRCHGNEVRR